MDIYPHATLVLEADIGSGVAIDSMPDSSVERMQTLSMQRHRLIF